MAFNTECWGNQLNISENPISLDAEIANDRVKFQLL